MSLLLTHLKLIELNPILRTINLFIFLKRDKKLTLEA
jgi:hypothetical protein